MKIQLIKNNKIYSYNLPRNVKDNFWITDFDSFDNVRNLINIEAQDGKWILKSNYETQIVSPNRNYDSIPLSLYNFYTIKNENERSYYYVYCAPSVENEILKYQITSNVNITIGSDSKNNIVYANGLVDNLHASLSFNNGIWTINDNKSRFGTFVNNERIIGSFNLKYGDVIFIAGLKIIPLHTLLLVSNVSNKVMVSSPFLVPKKNNIYELDKSLSKEEELDRNYYSKEDYFYRSPRFIEDVYQEEVNIEDPPAKIQQEQTPLILSIGPMFTMAITSLTTSFVTINNILNGESTWKKSMPSLMMAGAMFCSMLIWPLITKLIDKRNKKKKEKERLDKYGEYLSKKQEELVSIIKKQTQTLKDKYISLDDCANIILRKKSNLWERGLNQQDFLTLRLGIGNMPAVLNVKYSLEKFTMEEDELKKRIYSIVDENKMLNNVPVTMSFTEKYVTSIIGDDNLCSQFFKGLFLQSITFHSYDFLKFVILTSKDNENKWEYLKNTPYIFDDNHETRFFATDIDETKSISLYLEQIFQSRKSIDNYDYKNASEYYVILTDNYHIYRDIEIIKDILNQKINYGFSLIIFSNKLQNLPSECHNFISVGKEQSGVFESEIMEGHQKEFATEYCNENIFLQCVNRISNIPIEINTDDKQLPSLVSFLQMYNVGKVEQLNIANRWEANNSKKSLAVPVGIEKSGSLLKLDLHEKYHGPHGLIAGMTGSGKSEFIITYILSLAVNFSPNDVSFILIDYKGGGLAGAFENRETGVKLPHLAGTITNLDTQEINRSLASIQSELRRRQHLFNVARDKLGESTVDIYKYQSFFKEGKVSEPVPHLMVISDEFAELKSQQPDFMSELISAARIGRSLGVHLILATQKPSGVVNDQIWSNSRFRVCLKVQEKSDSNEMIKCPDAALLKNVGRFYLQVGYNELFALAQSAWCGAQYYPKDKLKKKIDQSLVVIDNIGNIVNSKEDDTNKLQEVSMGEELNNVLKHIISVSKSLNISAKPLWLPKISAEIYLDNLVQMFDYKEEKFILNPLIGMFDDPNNQHQGMVTIPLSTDGNTLIYGSGGSGKELLITTLVYSLISNHTPEEVNIYIVDFSSGTLKVFANAPHVGDVILSDQEEKINNLFKAINGEMEKRKRLFANYNGDYSGYIKYSGKTIPQMLIIINNYDAFQDTYDYSEQINQISRECDKYGIYLLFTVNSTSTVRFKTRQNFKANITLQFNDVDDYSSILGNVRKLYPANIIGRGLVRMDNIYEFQTAYVTKKDDLVEYIRNMCLEYSKKYTVKAREIPVVPEVVNVYDYVDKLTSLRKIPVGISHEYVDLEYFDFLSNYVTIVSSLESDSYKPFVEALIYMIGNLKDTSIVILDSDSLLNIDTKDNIALINNDINEPFIKLCNIVNEQHEVYVSTGYSNKTLINNRKMVVVINNLDKFLNKIGNDNKKKFEEMMINGKELETISFIICGEASIFKKYEYDSWYKSTISSNYGIWVGNGVTDQSVIKANIPYRNNLKEIGSLNGILIKNMKPSLVKLIKKAMEVL